MAALNQIPDVEELKRIAEEEIARRPAMSLEAEDVDLQELSATSLSLVQQTNDPLNGYERTLLDHFQSAHNQLIGLLHHEGQMLEQMIFSHTDLLRKQNSIGGNYDYFKSRLEEYSNAEQQLRMECVRQSDHPELADASYIKMAEIVVTAKNEKVLINRYLERFDTFAKNLIDNGIFYQCPDCIQQTESIYPTDDLLSWITDCIIDLKNEKDNTEIAFKQLCEQMEELEEQNKDLSEEDDTLYAQVKSYQQLFNRDNINHILENIPPGQFKEDLWAYYESLPTEEAAAEGEVLESAE